MKKSILIMLLIILINVLPAEEGMYPLSEIHNLDLKSKGLEIDLRLLYNPDGVSLIDAICIVGRGCTGSFVSEDGLILTNHHCSYPAVQGASTVENDYIHDGFIAASRGDEIEAKGYTIRITESYRDVSAEVLAVVTEQMDAMERTKKIEKKIKKIVAAVEKENPGKRADVKEMFIGKTYVLFIYTHLKDVRLVYVPPHSIGNYGGETDNWIWPRHTGDFSFLRVYVAADGTPAEYSPDNVPYKPKKILQVAPEGVADEDFVFILGYPGSTYRHRTSHFVMFEEDIRMPYVEQLHDWAIELMEEISKTGPDVELKHMSRIKSLANTTKNYKGKLQGLKRLNLASKKQNEEQALQQFIESSPELEKKYGSLLSDIGNVYDEYEKDIEQELILKYLKSQVNLLRSAYAVYEAGIELRKDDFDRESSYMDRNFPKTKERIRLALADYYETTDKIILKELLLRAARLPESKVIPAVQAIVKRGEPEKAIDKFIEKLYADSKFKNDAVFDKTLKLAPEKLKKMNDPAIIFAEALYPAYQLINDRRDARKGKLDVLSARLVDVKKMVEGSRFVPDANFTLRFTYGFIRGYSPRDAVYYSPITTLNGVVEKNTGVEPFNAPGKLLKLAAAENYGKFRHPAYNSVPVGILYNLDTTGGNSGSPVMNARGELVGLNFDRAFEATINDFAWSESYSRSIGVDIRYILWVVQKMGGADYLLEEMQVL